MTEHFTILHTNDFHNRLTLTQAERLTKLRSEIDGRGLLLDAGDAGGSGNVTFRTSGEPILETMSEIGYDAMTVGNRDFHVTRVGFKSKLFRARFPILCANIRSSNMNNVESLKDIVPDPPVEPFLYFDDLAGWKVVILGLTVPMITERMWERRLSGYIFDDPIKTASRLVPELIERYKPDLFIALTHIGLRNDRELSTYVPGIDIIIGGHSHHMLAEGEWSGKSKIVQTGQWGRYFGTVEIESRERVGGLLKITAKVETL